MRSGHRADNVKRVLHIGYPIAQGFVHGVLQRACARRHGANLGAQKLHAKDIGLLPLYIDFAHIDDTGQVKACRYCCGGDTMLPGPGLGNDTGLAHALCQQDLADTIVDFMSAGMIELVSFEVNFGPAQMLGHALCEIKRARATHIMFEIVIQLGGECRIGFQPLCSSSLNRESAA